MKHESLANYFVGIAAKKLAAVEINTTKSNQHEFNATKDMLDLLGRTNQEFRSKFIYFSDKSDEPLVDEANITLYNARENHLTRTEWRIYFQDSSVTEAAKPQDIFFLAKPKKGNPIIIIAESNSSKESQLMWLFGIDGLKLKGFTFSLNENLSKKEISFATNLILEQIGIEIDDEAPEYLEHMLKTFGERFPTTRVFSHYSRSTLKNIDPIDFPDEALWEWMNREELLFKTLEKHFLKNEIQILNSNPNFDSDDYMTLLMSYQQRRKSRAGSALENHLEHLFRMNQIHFDRTKITEGRLKPDFIFPSIEAYHAANKQDNSLTMLAAKTTCKDRWRQILNEAQKIEYKHLITFEPSISKHQTDEMITEKVKLIVPKKLLQTFTIEQQKNIMSLKEFINYLKSKNN